MNDIMVHASFNAYETCAKNFAINWDNNFHFIGAYLESDGSLQKYYTDMVKDSQLQDWTNGKPHSNIEIIKIEEDVNDIFDLVSTIKLKNNLTSHLFILKNFNNDLLQKIINKSYLQDDEKILMDLSKKWIVFHPKILNNFSTSQAYLEKTGNIITY